MEKVFKIEMDPDQVETLYKLAGYDITIPDALRADGAGEPFIAQVEKLFDVIRKRVDAAQKRSMALGLGPLF